MTDIKMICASVPLIPVLTIEDVDHAVPLAQALATAGLSVLEITLRTETALDAIEAVRAACPDAIVGAGTLRTPEDLSRCVAAGAQFGVSPGAPERLMDAVDASALPFLPGCASPTEVMRLADRGYRVLKFFPAEAAGGVRMLKSLAEPLSGIVFCPTGGVTIDNARDYLALPNVVTVGGSWVAPKALTKSEDWKGIENLARQAVAHLTQ
ncbi:MAG: bifunctional 4-hydroxy-2-oxoglutarate aldolase/2-dehydro-3-deoxy-phosphogluconate aldolase [Betaproteobacteria bacterium]|nr:MAG: bifunctional 4-hydroxy-2-oxoglutarate aldolase/2-dehydro-3-deoxy-phosphogluconate aldolase [Betaproteobacteria bacterium]